jgi:hypothetical protein
MENFDDSARMTRSAALACALLLASCSGAQTRNGLTPAMTPPAGSAQSTAIASYIGSRFVPAGAATTSPLFYTVGGESGTVSSAMSASTSSPRTNLTITSPEYPYVDSWGWIGNQSVGATSWPAATYTVSLNVTKANSALRIVGVKIYRVNQYGGPNTSGLAVVGYASGLSAWLGTTGVKTFSVDGSAQSADATDKLAVKFYTASSSSSAQSFAYDAGSGALSNVSISSSSGTVGSSPAPAPGTTAAPAPTASPLSLVRHVTVVVMENYDYSQVIGSPAAPYINSLAQQNALFTNSSAITHPSEPNYLALFSGSTQGLTSDACPVSYSGANLATQLAAKGLTFAGYAENFPGASPYSCEAGASPSVSSGYFYWRKHVPWADFTNVPLADFHDYTPGSPSLGATVTFITPNICDDMHDCGVAAGDAWASKNLPAILSWDAANDGLLVFTFDEGEYSSTNHIVTILAGPIVKPGQYTQSVNHYTVLRLIETLFGLPYLGGAASQIDMSTVLK